MVKNNGDNDMAADVTVEILSRLRVKSLMRFRCVCKYWYTIIRKSSFITKHLNQHSNKARLFVQHYNYVRQKYFFSLFPDENLASSSLSFYDFDGFAMPNYLEGVIGPFNGIFCLYDGCNEDRIALWNPATREFRPLTIPKPILPPYMSAFIHYFGFGSDPISNDNKVVWIRYFWDDKTDSPYRNRLVAVYTLRTGSWRLFEVDLSGKGSIQNSLCNTHMNGVYYWLTIENDHDYYRILGFDMTNENFQDVPVPPNIPRSQWSDLTLFNDFIALIHFDSHEVEKHFDIWVMKEQGVWTKHLTIGPIEEIERSVGIWKNGEIFLETSTAELALYNTNTKDIKILGPRGHDHCLKVFLYKESLVPVKGEDECQEGNDSLDKVRFEEYFSTLFRL